MIDLSWFGEERGRDVLEGWHAAARAMAMSYPPREDDPSGTLLNASLAHQVQQEVKAALAEYSGRQRRQWIEGFLLGLLDEVATCLDRASSGTGATAVEMFQELCKQKQDAPEGVAQATALVARLGSALAQGDTPGVLAQLENIWRIVRNGQTRPAPAVKALITASASMCVTTWMLHLPTAP